MIICGDETGLLKAVDPSRKSSRLVSTSISQNRRRGVAALCSDGSSSLFRCARKDGSLETWVSSSQDYFEDDAWSLGASCEGLVGDCVGLSSSLEGKVISCADDGRVQISSCEEGAAAGDRGLLDVEGSVSAFDTCENVVAVGGREHELSVWNLENFEREWRSRNVPNDKLDLRRPVWVASAKFVDRNVLIVGTKYKELRLYDTREQRRPVRELTGATEHAVRQLVTLGPDRVLVGDIAGMVQTFNIKTMTLENRFVGPAGSTRGLAKHPHLDTQFAAAGLDRHCHVWDTTRRDKRNAISSVYCKQRLTSIIWLPEDESSSHGDEEEEEEEDASSSAS